MSNISLITGECRGYAHAFLRVKGLIPRFLPLLCPFNCNMRRGDRLIYRWTECSQSHVILQIQLLRECFTIHPLPLYYYYYYKLKKLKDLKRHHITYSTLSLCTIKHFKHENVLFILQKMLMFIYL